MMNNFIFLIEAASERCLFMESRAAFENLYTRCEAVHSRSLQCMCVISGTLPNLNLRFLVARHRVAPLQLNASAKLGRLDGAPTPPSFSAAYFLLSIDRVAVKGEVLVLECG